MFALSKKELDVIVSETTEQQIKAGKIIAKSWSKKKKANAFSELLGDGSNVIDKPRVPTRRTILSLSELAYKVVSKFPKIVLNAIYAACIYPEHHAIWVGKSPFGPSMTVDCIPDCGDVPWFSLPEINAVSGKPMVKCLDGHHLLVNLRAKVCKDGVQGVRKEAWHKVAEHDSTIISKSLVEDLIDKQRNSYAKWTFSKEVEECMVELGFKEEAKFTKLVREWYEAEDDRSIPAIERTRRRLLWREYLLRDVSFGSFPPSGMYIKGFPQVMYEGFLSSIDSHIQLYALARSGSYNQRAFSSLENETFFGTLGDLDPTRLGCPKAVNISRLMASVCEVMHYRQDPESRLI